MFDLEVGPAEKAKFLEAVKLCCTWMANTRNIAARPWGAYHAKDSADLGRILEKSSPDRFMLGGVYGQSNYATARDVVHGRDTGYALQLWLRLAGFPARTYGTLGWKPASAKGGF